MADQPHLPHPSPADDSGAPAPSDAERHAEDELAIRIERITTLSDALRQCRKEASKAQQEARKARQEADALRASLRSLRARGAIRIVLAVSRRTSRLASIGRGSGRPARVPDDEPASAQAPRGPRPNAAPVADDWSRGAFLGRIRAGGLRVVTVGLPPSIARGLREAGWPVTEALAGDAASLAGADVVITADAELDVRDAPDGTVRIAWVAERPDAWVGRPWFDEADLVLAPDDAAAASVAAASVHAPGVAGSPNASNAARIVREHLEAWTSVPHIDLAIGPPDWDVAPSWGDYHFGRALQRALLARGHPTRIRLRSAWDSPAAGRADTVIQLFGLAERPRRPGQVNVLWVISHPLLLEDAYVAAHDVVFVASDAFARQLAARTGREVQPLHQATDPQRFRPVAGGPAHQLLFVANSRGARRPIVDELSPTTRDLAVYGRNWTDDRIDPRHLRGEYVPNEALAAYYAAATIVLNDHWADMAAHGFLSNRLYDAAAAGAFVLSDYVEGIEAEFDGGIATFRTGRELRRLVERFLADPDGRAGHAAAAMAAVRARHTMGQRADRILEVLSPLLADRASPTHIGQAR